MKKNKINPLAEEWLIRAKDDEKTALLIIKEKGAYSVACFMAQQMTEKILKALLIISRKDFPKVHDLIKLSSLLQDEYPEILQSYLEELKLLNPYYIETRYPGDWPINFSLKEAKESLMSAQKIKDFVLEKINKKS